MHQFFKEKKEDFKNQLGPKENEIRYLKKEDQTTWKTFTTGNEPVIRLEKETSPEKIALIATAGLRAVSIACQIGHQNNIPKIILIDNSRLVIEFWKGIRGLALEHREERSFITAVKNFCDENRPLYRSWNEHGKFTTPIDPDVQYESLNLLTFLTELCQKYSFKFVRNIICRAILIIQTWEDSTVFEKLKSYLDKNAMSNIYVYASNIVECIAKGNFYTKPDPTSATKILENIKILNPTVCIHVNYEEEKVPDKVTIEKNTITENQTTTDYKF